MGRLIRVGGVSMEDRRAPNGERKFAWIVNTALLSALIAVTTSYGNYRMNGMERRAEGLIAEVSRGTARLSTVEETLMGIKAYFASIERRLERIEGRMDRQINMK